MSDAPMSSSTDVPTTLHGCVVDTFGPGVGQARCGQPGSLWTAPNGNQHIVCPEHQAQFETNAQGAP